MNILKAQPILYTFLGAGLAALFGAVLNSLLLAMVFLFLGIFVTYLVNKNKSNNKEPQNGNKN